MDNRFESNSDENQTLDSTLIKAAQLLKISVEQFKQIIDVFAEQQPLQLYSLENAAPKLDMTPEMLQYYTSPGNVQVPFAWLGKAKKFYEADLKKWYQENRVATLRETRQNMRSKPKGQKKGVKHG